MDLVLGSPFYTFSTIINNKMVIQTNLIKIGNSQFTWNSNEIISLFSYNYSFFVYSFAIIIGIIATFTLLILPRQQPLGSAPVGGEGLL